MDTKEYKERLDRAAFAITQLRSAAALNEDRQEHTRLSGKLDGINLAISYLREMDA